MNERFKKRKATAARHSEMQCRVFDLKVDKSKLHKATEDALSRLFMEAKQFHNHILTENKEGRELDTKKTTVMVRNKDMVMEERPLKVLSAQMRQEMRVRFIRNCKALKTAKARGRRIGKIKYKSEESCIPLVQFGDTHKIYPETKTVKIQKIAQRLKVHGMDQIDFSKKPEFANANLLCRHGDYYVQVTAFFPKEAPVMTGKAVGIDLGCTNQLTFSNGCAVRFNVQPSKRTKLAQKMLSRKKKGSKNRRKAKIRLEKAAAHDAAKRKDIRNKLVSAVVKEFDVVVVQDDSIKGWSSGGHGKKISGTGIGGIKEALKQKARTPIMVDRFSPTTKECLCGYGLDPSLWDRTVECPICGLSMDRDWKASISILNEGLKQLPAERRCTLVETPTADIGDFVNRLNLINGIECVKLGSLKQEATML